MISDELDQKGDVNNDIKRIHKLGDQVERYNKHICKFLETFEENLEKIVGSETVDDLKEMENFVLNWDINKLY